jgi:hypothetical protein
MAQIRNGFCKINPKRRLKKPLNGHNSDTLGPFKLKFMWKQILISGIHSRLDLGMP